MPGLRPCCTSTAATWRAASASCWAPCWARRPDSFREAGVRLGIAMQLTNVLRDVGEDLANDRVYLPADELASFGLSRAALEDAPRHARLPPVHAVAGGARAPLLRGWRSRGAALPQRRKPAHRAAAAAHLRGHPRRHRADRLRRVPHARVRLDPAQAHGAGPRDVVRAAVDDVAAVRAIRCESRGAACRRRTRRPGPIAVWAFARYFRGLFRRHFASVRWAALDEPAGWDRSVPVLFVSNHTNWWDGFFSFVLTQEFGTHLPHPHGGGEPRSLSRVQAHRDAAAASRQPHGCLGGPARADRVLRPGAALWIYPQGQRRPAGEQPMPARAGRGTPRGPARRVPLRICPVAFRYPFMSEQLPEAIALVGRSWLHDGQRRPEGT